MYNEEWEILLKSHSLMCMFSAQSSKEKDEMIFIEFRPRWLKSQKNVYRSMFGKECVICMNACFLENTAIQHNKNHPCICCRCFDKLSSCPFCRLPFAFAVTPLLTRIL